VQTTHQLTYGGLPRSYLLIRPQARGQRLPVVVVLHGRNATPALEAARTGLPAVTGPAVLVYPAGYGQSWDAGACCGPAQAAGVDDVGFVAGVLRDVQAGNPDTSGAPVYIVGYSNGGKLAYRLACAEPSLFTAVAAVGAVAVSPCPSPAPIPFVEVASLGDPELAYGTAPPVRLNGYTELNVDAQVGQRAQANGCRSSASTTEGVLTITRWAGCLPGRAVELALYRGGSHSWPAGDASTPPAQVVVWRFFRSSLVST
jgi:polyhydroxybutyrate depolymerase